MKRIVLLAIAVLSIFGIQSCNKDNFGYEKVVEFTADGGTQTVTGPEPIYELSIANYNGKTVSVELPDTLKSTDYERILTNYRELSPSLNGRNEWQPWECEVYIQK